jgi:hypothetical protein
MANVAMIHLRRISMILVMAAPLAACSGAGLADGTTPADGTPPAEGTPAPTSERDVFAGLPYRIDLPGDWIALGASGYDTAMDSTPDMQAWLAGLGLEGQNAFRAYEPLDGGAGLRLAVNPQRTWNPSPLQEEGAVAALPGVTGKIDSDVLAVGDAWKAFGYRWSESIDWGDGGPASRDCIGYFVMVDPNPVNVVFCYPSGTDRREEVEAIVATFEMTGTPVFSLAPGETPTPEPTPFDKNASPAPSVAIHVAPELEALLPEMLGGRPVEKESMTGTEAGATPDDPILAAFGKQPSDLAAAQGIVKPGDGQPAALLAVQRLEGVSGDALLAAMLDAMPEAKVSEVSLGGHEVTYVEYGAWPVWYYATGDVVYAVGLAGEAAAAEFFASLP